jgi:hypothetical protein
MGDKGKELETKRTQRKPVIEPKGGCTSITNIDSGKSTVALLLSREKTF